MVTVEEVLEYIKNETDCNAWIYGQGGKWYIETEYCSSLGEDVIDDVWFDEYTGKALIKALYDSILDYANKCEEDVEMYIRCRPHGTEHFSARQLVEDADWKIEFWTQFVYDLGAHFEWRH